MENRVLQAETGANMGAFSGVLRETAKVAIGMTKVIVREATPELAEGYETYDATLRMLEGNRLRDLHTEEKGEKYELENVRRELAELSIPDEDRSEMKVEKRISVDDEGLEPPTSSV